ncbi:MAG: non-canonical purine NTP pyrophosphatase, RdgB/HAM1 family [Candidatus Levybacteria bacterium CG10_big_fil_rev_8_21_14_0_10_35_13]|nr:MAG: non-canonical purine NTP pyrophosphatase, RdgB/HAM1 family [Candidatus Levybacteria bacterium CG10_big_fil_rev_8_21_14_0_10_35_13]
MKKIFIATTNKGKVEEISEMLKIPLGFAKLELDEVQSMDLEYVARKKVEKAFKILKKPVIVDDVGVYFKAWNEFPGPFVKYVHNLLGNKKVLKLFQKEKNRNVVVRCAVAFHDGRKIHTFLGSVNGTLALREKGSWGWGFDPIIIPSGYFQTFAEMGVKKKNLVSHRGKAFKKLKKFLESQK